LLSLDIVNLAPSNSKTKYLSNAISCFDPLMLTFQQRNIESQHKFDEEANCFIPLLKFLYVLQDEILYKFVSASKLILRASHLIIKYSYTVTSLRTMFYLSGCLVLIVANNYIVMEKYFNYILEIIVVEKIYTNV